MSWVRWDHVCLPKNKGGLGIKHLSTFNLALQAKWRWRLLDDGDNPLWKNVLTARYGNYEDWFNELHRQNELKKTSLWWRDLMMLGDTTCTGGGWFKEVVKKKMGDGSNTSFWNEKWLGIDTLAELFPSLVEHSADNNAMVANMGQWEYDRWEWKLYWKETLPEGAVAEVAALVMLLRDVAPRRDAKDKWIWLPNSVGGFTVKECYNWLSERDSISEISRDEVVEACKKLWKNDLPSKVLIFSWRVLWNKLPTRENLHKRGIIGSQTDADCVFCHRDLETNAHLFCNCRITRAVWKEILSWVGEECDVSTEVGLLFNEMGSFVKGKRGKGVKHLICTATWWNIWLARNRVIFNGEEVSVKSIVLAVKYMSWGWFIARKGRNSGLCFSDWFNCPLGCISSI